MQLARGGVQQVRAAHDLAYALGCVVDDHGEIVCGGAIVAAHDEIVDDVAARAEQPVGERDDRAGGAQAQRGRAAGALAFRALRGGQLAAGSGVGPVRAAPRAAPTPPRGSRRACSSRGTAARRASRRAIAAR